MKTSDVDILIVPDLGDAVSDHWQSRWERNLKTARRIDQTEWHKPRGEDWAGAIVDAAHSRKRSTVLVAHGLGVLAVAQAAERLGATVVVGAFLVAPRDLDAPGAPGTLQAAATGLTGFWPLPAEPFAFPALVIASSDDPDCTVARARAFAHTWGANFTEAGAVGHLDTASGHGPWPEGLLRFGQFLRDLG